MGEKRKKLKIWLKRTQKISEAKDSPFEDRSFLGQGLRRKCSPKKKKNSNMVFKNFFQVILKKKNLQKNPNFSTKNDLQNIKDSKNTTVLGYFHRVTLRQEEFIRGRTGPLQPASSVHQCRPGTTGGILGPCPPK